MDRQFKADAERVQASLSQISDRAYAIIRDFVDANGGSYDFDEDDAPYADEYACGEECAIALYGGDREQFEEDLQTEEQEPGTTECYWSVWQ